MDSLRITVRGTKDEFAKSGTAQRVSTDGKASHGYKTYGETPVSEHAECKSAVSNSANSETTYCEYTDSKGTDRNDAAS